MLSIPNWRDSDHSFDLREAGANREKHLKTTDLIQAANLLVAVLRLAIELRRLHVKK